MAKDIATGPDEKSSPEDDFIKYWTDVGRSFGLDSVTSRLFGMLFIEPGEVAMDELALQTGYSLASISNKMKLLEGIGLVRRTKKPGSKKIYYFLPKSLFQLMRNKLERVYKVEIEPAKQVIPKILEKYRGQRLDENRARKKKIITSYYNELMQIEELMGDFRTRLEDLEKRQYPA